MSMVHNRSYGDWAPPSRRIVTMGRIGGVAIGHSFKLFALSSQRYHSALEDLLHTAAIDFCKHFLVAVAVV